jgi:hypothetical protein
MVQTATSAVYDAWLGPAPMKPFCADRCLIQNPRGIFNISDYSLGMLANWGAHSGLLDSPSSVIRLILLQA